MMSSLSDRPTQAQSRFFAGSLYTSAALLPFEQQHIFRQTWLYIGQEQELIQSGTVRMLEVAGSSILITRGKDGNLRAFHNVCPHRAALFCSEPGSHQLKHLVCPYHAWTYSLEGDLVGVPREGRFSEDFCRSDYALMPIRLELWQNFIFICFSEAAPPLHDFLGGIPTALSNHFTPETTLLTKQQYLVNCNWKAYHDNTLCDYHVAVAHRTTLDVIQGPVNRYQHKFDTFVNLLYTPTTADWQTQNPVLEGLDDRSRNGFFTFGIFPNLHLLALPNGLVAWLRIDPLTVDTCLLNSEIYGIPALCRSIDQVTQEFDAFTQEDIAITEGVQRGYASGVYRSGPVNQLEDRIAHQQQMIWQFLQAGLERDRSSVHPEVAAVLSGGFTG
ncbi:aromatic ring-hydroxylating oxygenase subunit alpha [Leptolyngbya ohadii]|uniref:aromatic ring-hydroxylating oxygenase subunit alpha n=1 Tax=Leptolyngbya ohadii TaxID=1962290 RepID=UPI0019D4DCC5|nr:aromatic ring-hydroxylating dioxygenase subunit alpha [Leptolyngbya ohadii]